MGITFRLNWNKLNITKCSCKNLRWSILSCDTWYIEHHGVGVPSSRQHLFVSVLLGLQLGRSTMCLLPPLWVVDSNVAWACLIPIDHFIDSVSASIEDCLSAYIEGPQSQHLFDCYSSKVNSMSLLSCTNLDSTFILEALNLPAATCQHWFQDSICSYQGLLCAQMILSQLVFLLDQVKHSQCCQ